jgi:hypothetical protein
VPFFSTRSVVRQTIGDAVMWVQSEFVPPVEATLDLVDHADNADLPQRQVAVTGSAFRSARRDAPPVTRRGDVAGHLEKTAALSEMAGYQIRN